MSQEYCSHKWVLNRCVKCSTIRGDSASHYERQSEVIKSLLAELSALEQERDALRNEKMELSGQLREANMHRARWDQTRKAALQVNNESIEAVEQQAYALVTENESLRKRVTELEHSDSLLTLHAEYRDRIATLEQELSDWRLGFKTRDD